MMSPSKDDDGTLADQVEQVEKELASLEVLKDRILARDDVKKDEGQVVMAMYPKNESPTQRILREMMIKRNNLMDKKEIIREEQRVSRVLEEYERMRAKRGIQNADNDDGANCPICQDTLPPLGVGTNRAISPCCGAQLCATCQQESQAQVDKLCADLDRCLMVKDRVRAEKIAKRIKNILVCPCCRAVPPATDEEFLINIQREAKKGAKWALLKLGGLYRKGGLGVEKDEQKALELLQTAAEKGYTPAMHELGIMFGRGAAQSYPRALKYLEDAAMRGCARSQAELGMNCLHNPEFYAHDRRWPTGPLLRARGVFFFTLAAEQGYAFARMHLGMCHFLGTGINGYPSCAMYWLEKAASAAKDIEDPPVISEAAENLGSIIAREALDRYQRPDLLGTNAFPRAVFWSLKAKDALICDQVGGATYANNEWAKHEVNSWKDKMQALCGAPVCAHCGAEGGEDGRRLKTCDRCKICYFCSRECQTANWKAGHKSDCRDNRIFFT